LQTNNSIGGMMG